MIEARSYIPDKEPTVACEGVVHISGHILGWLTVQEACDKVVEADL